MSGAGAVPRQFIPFVREGENAERICGRIVNFAGIEGNKTGPMSTEQYYTAIGYICRIMAHSIDEVEEMVAIASSLVINFGTLSKEWIEAMLLAG